MKEATGELNMTVIVIIAIAAVAALFYAFLWPAIKSGMRSNVCKSWTTADGDAFQFVTNSSKDYCCPTATYSATECIDITEE